MILGPFPLGVLAVATYYMLTRLVALIMRPLPVVPIGHVGVSSKKGTLI